ncbi:MAG: type II toxin-antitoxin system VapC family toxin [Verrucomicrobiales bacterium]|nr:type II toxin-antitoxin system VapC family toxin [Verrucomicrobiales bacterium]
MSANFVLDCSVTMTWFFVHEANRETDELLAELAGNGVAFVPLHWRLEVGNVLLIAERKKGRTRAETEQFVMLLGALSIETDEQTDKRACSNILALAREHKLTTYDAAYLDLASSRGVALASLDRDLRAAAKKLGVKVLPPTI